jgi:hypothetical protein
MNPNPDPESGIDFLKDAVKKHQPDAQTKASQLLSLQEEDLYRPSKFQRMQRFIEKVFQGKAP